MALFRTVLAAPKLMTQCSRVLATQIQSSRLYSEMALTFASPGEVFFHNQNVKQIDAETVAGAVGILPNHVPTLAVLKPGVVKVVVDEKTTRNVFVSSGSLAVNVDGSVQIMVEEGTDVENIDKDAAQSAMQAAQAKTASSSNEVERAELQVEIDAYDAILKA